MIVALTEPSCGALIRECSGPAAATGSRRIVSVASL